MIRRNIPQKEEKNGPGRSASLPYPAIKMMVKMILVSKVAKMRRR